MHANNYYSRQMDGARDFSLHCEFYREKNTMSFILLFRLRKLFVESSLVLDLPTHLIIPSANIKLNEAIGEGNSRSQCQHNDHYCIIIL